MVRDYLSFVVVSAYLTLVLFFLLLSGRLDPNVSLRTILVAAVRRLRAPSRKPEELADIVHEVGHCYTARLASRWVSDREGWSRVQVFEDGRPLPRPHTSHEAIRQDGRGAFSHWGPLVYFSASDNSDPRANGRIYVAAEQDPDVPERAVRPAPAGDAPRPRGGGAIELRGAPSPPGAPAAPDPVLRWWRDAGVAVCESPIVATARMDMAADVLRTLVTTTGAEPHIRSAGPCWKLAVDDDGPELAPLTTAPSRVHTVVFPTPEGRVGLAALWYWRRRGAKEFWFHHLDGWRRADGDVTFASLVYRRIFRRVLGVVLPPLSMNHEVGEQVYTRWTTDRRGREWAAHTSRPSSIVDDAGVWTRYIEADNALAAAVRPPHGRPLHVMQYIGALGAGGAERQLCNLTIGLAARGYRVDVVTMYEPVGELGHYRRLLVEHGLPVRRAGQGGWDDTVRRQVDWSLILAAPPELRDQVSCLVAELLVARPDVLHGWLDAGNIVGGIAGLIAGVPRILLSTRNSNPTNFPRLNSPYMDPWYRLLVRSRRVRLLANSHSGAASYASWIGMPEDEIHVVLNGLRRQDLPEPTAAARRAARQAFALPERARVVAGAFRLDAEKQPELFLEVVRRAAASVDELRVLVAGTGPLEGRMREVIKRDGMEARVRLLGPRTDVESVFLASDVFLLTSTLEGCPNAALEAQYLGLPVVATAGGGTTDAVVHGRTGYLAGIHDAAALAGHLTRLLTDDDLRRRLGGQAHAFVVEAFDLDRMIDLTALVYARMFMTPETSAARVVSPRPVR
jgi:glycosyltransferase involved in cell wall biosynthesis